MAFRMFVLCGRGRLARRLWAGRLSPPGPGNVPKWPFGFRPGVRIGQADIVEQMIVEIEKSLTLTVQCDDLPEPGEEVETVAGTGASGRVFHFANLQTLM
ncbi:MAG: hypothetical protein R3E44_06260 [Paracoccaceae bacterium]